MRYCFGQFEIDEDGRELRRRNGTHTNGGSRVEAPPKVLALLRDLVRNAPRVVTRNELLASVWQGQVVSESALNTVVKSLRHLIDDDDQRFVRTVHGIGYAFVMPVERRGPSTPSALSETRRRLFVGRDAEIARLASWLSDPSRPDGPRLFWLHGVGGVGKTTLLHRLETLAFEHNVPMVTISCAHLRPSPEALLQAIATSYGVETPSTIPRQLAASPVGLLVLDGYEAVRGIDDWVRERFVQQLPVGWRLVLSGRSPPGMRWRVDPTWTTAEEIPLGDLSPVEAEALLERRGVAAPEREKIVRFAGGHPLTLVLATDSLRRTGRFSESLSTTNELAPALIDSFVREAPSKQHRDALDCLAVVDALDEPLLAAMLGDDASATECFDWLSTLGMVETHPAGLVLHDLAKATLTANLAWRNSARLGTLVERAYTKLFTDLERSVSAERRRRLVTSLWGIFELHPALAPMMALPKLSGTASGAELERIEQLVERFEGRANAAALRFWLARDPTYARVVRDKDGVMLGYSVFVKVEPGDDEARAADPLLRELDASLEQVEKYSVARWFADCSAYHDVTPVSVGCHVLNTERELSALDDEICCHFVLVANPDAWMPMLRLANFGDKMVAVPLDGFSVSAFAHDMRNQTLLTWFRAFTRRVMDTLTTGEMVDFGIR